jgi:hypothetical protein
MLTARIKMASKLGKVAICISGLVRTGVPAHVMFEKFFGHLNADVFYHTWKTDKKTSNQIKTLYNPISYKEQTQLTNTEMGSWGNMLYSMMQANELKKKYEIAMNFRYDLVIKTRFDLVFPPANYFPTTPIDPRTIYTSGGNTGVNHTDYEHHGINDIIFWGDSQSMDIATDVYLYYKHRTLVANRQLLAGHMFDPQDYYFSAGNLIYNRCITRNLHINKYVQSICEVPWREDVDHLNPLKDFNAIRRRYQKPAHH